MAKKKKLTKQKRVKITSKPATKKSKPILPVVEEPLNTKYSLIIAFLIAVIGILVYVPSHNYDFVYDDDAVIKDNRYVKEGFDGLGKIWSTGYFRGYNEAINARAYRPVPLSTLAIELALFDNSQPVNGVLTPNPAIYHKTNLIYYGLTGFFLFLFLAKLLRKYHPIFPIMISLLFILHPIHLEVVANIKSRDTILGFLNYTIAAWLLLKYIDQRKIWQMGLAVLFYLIGLFSKEEIITTLAVIPLLLYFFRDLSLKDIGKLTIPFFVSILFYLVIRTGVIVEWDFASANSFKDLINPGLDLKILDNSLLAAQGLNEQSASRAYALGHYLSKTVYPHPLLSDYSYSTLPLMTWGNWQAWLSLIFNLGIVAGAIIGILRKQFYGFALSYYIIGLSIFSNLVTTNVSVYNDRFLYNAVFGICALIAWGLYKLMKTEVPEGAQESLPGFIKRNIWQLLIFVIILSAAVVKIESHLPYWKDRYALFSHDAQKAPNNARMRKNNGGSLARLAVQNQSSDRALSREYAQQAIDELKAGLSIYDRMETGHVHLGNMYLILNDLNNAEQSFKRALEIFPNGHYAKVNLANTYHRQGRYQESINMLEAMPKTYFTQNDYYLMYLSYSKLGDSANMEKYRKLAGR